MHPFGKLISSTKYWIYGPEVIYSEQFMYGGIEVLRKFYRVEGNLLLKGSLQHGWVDGGNAAQRQEIYVNFRRAIDFVWSERMFLELANLGRSNVQVIGSPWAHLVEQLERKKQQDIRQESNSKKLLYIPAHSYPGWTFFPKPKLVNSELSPERIVLLSWIDFVNPIVRKSFLDDGYQVECAGYRGASAFEAPWSDNGGRAGFLEEFYNLMSASSIVAVDDISTPFWYALSLSKPIIITDNKVVLSYWDRNTKQNETFTSNNELIAESIGLNSIPIGSIIEPSRELVALARRELGFDSVGKGNLFFENRKYSFECKI